ncbi:MAG: D-alanine--D-alanine ligase [Clostridia bacterium]|nr:D-alanine--D-alanine ligase [Clostridia bacterium]
MKITVLAGGLSHEREVSLSSGSLIAGALIRKGHEVCLVDLYTGKAIDGAEPAFTHDPIEPYRVSRIVPDLEALKASTGNGDRRIGAGVPALCHAADAVFIALHGDVGENGQLQAFLDMEGIPYTGSGYAGSLLAMDKDLTKQMLTRAGVTNAPWVYCDLSVGVEATADRIEKELGYPMVIKPCSGGSSVGVSMPECRAELTAAIEKASRYEATLMAERRIVGRELTVSYLDGEVLPAVEIIPLTGFYDYENKYQAGQTDEICPASLTEAEVAALESATRRGFEALRLRGYARFDFILDENGTPWCLEANTLPGMTPTSLLPQAAAAVGSGYDELCEKMILMAMKGR